MIPRPAQPTPGSGPPDSTQSVLPKPVAADVFQLDVLALLAQRVEHGLLRQAAQQQPRGVGLGVAADHHHLLAHLGQRGDGVLGGGALADATFAVDRHLACSRLHHLRHCLVLPTGPRLLAFRRYRGGSVDPTACSSDVIARAVPRRAGRGAKGRRSHAQHRRRWLRNSDLRHPAIHPKAAGGAGQNAARGPAEPTNASEAGVVRKLSSFLARGTTGPEGGGAPLSGR